MGLTKPFEITVWHYLLHDPAVEIVGVDLHDVRGGKLRIVEEAYQLVVGPGFTDACVTDTAANVRLNNAIHHRVNNKLDRLVNVFELRG